MALEGNFDFINTPLAPPGTKVIIHEKPGQQKYWEPHGLEGWYLGPDMEHYRCHTLYVNKTRAENIADTIEFSPKHNKIPVISNKKAANNEALGLIEAISDPSQTSPFAFIGDNTLHSMRKLEDIFKQKTNPKKSPHKEISHTRVEVKHNNPPKTTASLRVKLPINLPTPACT